mmetsp:Transcript_19344/g.54789  ORF Transcript_19344/g.54789 Transcript_19344/m.54789 type:complete len:203 (+) Transcript_19344:491-1099(+)
MRLLAVHHAVISGTRRRHARSFGGGNANNVGLRLALFAADLHAARRTLLGGRLDRKHLLPCLLGQRLGGFTSHQQGIRKERAADHDRKRSSRTRNAVARRSSIYRCESRTSLPYLRPGLCHNVVSVVDVQELDGPGDVHRGCRTRAQRSGMARAARILRFVLDRRCHRDRHERIPAPQPRVDEDASVAAALRQRHVSVHDRS